MCYWRSLCHTVLSDPCSLVVTCWKRADLLALLCVMFSCDFVTFPYGVLSQVWYLIESIPDICLLHYLHIYDNNFKAASSHYSIWRNHRLLFGPILISTLLLIYSRLCSLGEPFSLKPNTCLPWIPACL